MGERYKPANASKNICAARTDKRVAGVRPLNERPNRMQHLLAKREGG